MQINTISTQKFFLYTVGWMGQILELGQYLGLKLSPNHGWGLVGSVLLSLLQ